MPFPRATGSPDYSSGSTSKFIPAIWASKLLVKFYDATVFHAISNTEYEGEIKAYGDTVHIRTTPTITIRKYVKGQTLVHQRPDSPAVDLNIDQGRYFDLILDDVDRVQSDIKLMDDWTRDASEEMKIDIDTGILSDIPADADASNKGLTAGRKSASFNLGATGTPLTLNKINIVDTLVDCGTILDEQNMPESERWMVLPGWATNFIKKSDLKDASLSGDGTSMLRNGRIGMIDRFMIYYSNLVSTVTDGGTVYNILFGHKSALTFASQMVELDTLKAESTFGQIVRGLNVYGFKVIKPVSMGLLYAKK
ncbi:MAG: hypothetical protein ABGX83_05555 [Nitrospira sp.]